jgi:Holliday junction resolvasome RuvABC endonuclease subunit
MLALGIDSATNTGLATVSFLEGKFTLIDSETKKIVDPCYASLSRRRWEFAAIELPYLATGSKMNPQTMQFLSRIYGWWESTLARNGIPYVGVYPNEWQSAILGYCGKREERKKSATVFCKCMFKTDLPSDEADAACIAYWAIKQQLAKGKT